jgi:ankyrin repeat protein
MVHSAEDAAELLDAVIKGDGDAVRVVLRRAEGRAAADIVCGEPETTPLLEAVKGEHTAIVSLLLEASADPDRVPAADPNGEPPGDSPLQHAAAEGFLVRTVHIFLTNALP